MLRDEMSREDSDTEKENIRIDLPQQWIKFVDYCRKIKDGEIDRLRIRDGRPVSAETKKEKHYLL